MAADTIFFSPPVHLYSCSNACNDGTHRNKLFFYPSLLKQGIKRNQVSSVNTHSIFQACKNGILAGGERASLIDRLGNVKDPRYLVWALWRWITPKATDPSRFSLRKCDSRLKKDSRDLQVIRQQAKEKRKNPLSLIWHQNKCKLISF